MVIMVIWDGDMCLPNSRIMTMHSNSWCLRTSCESSDAGFHMYKLLTCQSICLFDQYPKPCTASGPTKCKIENLEPSCHVNSISPAQCQPYESCARQRTAENADQESSPKYLIGSDTSDGENSRSVRRGRGSSREWTKCSVYVTTHGDELS
ncbi:hypothetical protein GQ44DRAFT_481404 [Phaeosphaeriaceae sp. PMI808]|nr:hypothetical protein GQ44DRAFT_481404 [Phaeosphaeriaceae sp. PMI808]